jgi:hypothetical protein
MSTERKALARAIHKAGTVDPDSLAEYLIREGWAKRREASGGGLVSTIGAVNIVQDATLQPLMAQVSMLRDRQGTDRRLI